MADPAPFRTPPTGDDLDAARRALATERKGLDALAATLDGDLGGPFREAVALIRDAPWRVVVSGMGKSGHVGRKVSATLASTGTPAFFVHPAEASHGDLGMVTPGDVVLALSWSGETPELASLIEYTRRWDIALVAMTASRDGALARHADLVLALPRVTEACPHGLAPTTSALVQLALGDALAIALLESRGFTAEHYRGLHPGGRLGADLNRVAKIMHAGREMPLARGDAPMAEALLKMTEKRFGCLGVVDDDGRLVGIVTDGDLRRHMGADLLALSAADIMTRGPRTVTPDTLVGAALDLMNQARITVLFVVEDGRPAGVVHMHDLLRIGVA